MKAKLVEFNDDGKVSSKKPLDVYFASSSKPPTICVVLPDKQFKHRQVYIPLKGLLALIMDRYIDNTVR